MLLKKMRKSLALLLALAMVFTSFTMPVTAAEVTTEETTEQDTDSSVPEDTSEQEAIYIEESAEVDEEYSLGIAEEIEEELSEENNDDSESVLEAATTNGNTLYAPDVLGEVGRIDTDKKVVAGTVTRNKTGIYTVQAHSEASDTAKYFSLSEDTDNVKIGPVTDGLLYIVASGNADSASKYKLTCDEETIASLSPTLDDRGLYKGEFETLVYELKGNETYSFERESGVIRVGNMKYVAKDDKNEDGEAPITKWIFTGDTYAGAEIGKNNKVNNPEIAGIVFERKEDAAVQSFSGTSTITTGGNLIVKKGTVFYIPVGNQATFEEVSIKFTGTGSLKYEGATGEKSIANAPTFSDAKDSDSDGKIKIVAAETSDLSLKGIEITGGLKAGYRITHSGGKDKGFDVKFGDNPITTDKERIAARGEVLVTPQRGYVIKSISGVYASGDESVDMAADDFEAEKNGYAFKMPAGDMKLDVQTVKVNVHTLSVEEFTGAGSGDSYSVKWSLESDGNELSGVATAADGVKADVKNDFTIPSGADVELAVSVSENTAKGVGEIKLNTSVLPLQKIINNGTYVYNFNINGNKTLRAEIAGIVNLDFYDNGETFDIRDADKKYLDPIGFSKIGKGGTFEINALESSGRKNVIESTISGNDVLFPSVSGNAVDAVDGVLSNDHTKYTVNVYNSASGTVSVNICGAPAYAFVYDDTNPIYAVKEGDAKVAGESLREAGNDSLYISSYESGTSTGIWGVWGKTNGANDAVILSPNNRNAAELNGTNKLNDVYITTAGKDVDELRVNVASEVTIDEGLKVSGLKLGDTEATTLSSNDVAVGAYYTVTSEKKFEPDTRKENEITVKGEGNYKLIAAPIVEYSGSREVNFEDIEVVGGNGVYTFNMPDYPVAISSPENGLVMAYEVRRTDNSGATVNVYDGEKNKVTDSIIGNSSNPTYAPGETVYFSVTPSTGNKVQEVKWGKAGDLDKDLSTLLPVDWLGSDYDSKVYKFTMPDDIGEEQGNSKYVKIKVTESPVYTANVIPGALGDAVPVYNVYDTPENAKAQESTKLTEKGGQLLSGRTKFSVSDNIIISVDLGKNKILKGIEVHSGSAGTESTKISGTTFESLSNGKYYLKLPNGVTGAFWLKFDVVEIYKLTIANLNEAPDGYIEAVQYSLNDKFTEGVKTINPAENATAEAEFGKNQTVYVRLIADPSKAELKNAKIVKGSLNTTFRLKNAEKLESGKYAVDFSVDMKNEGDPKKEDLDTEIKLIYSPTHEYDLKGGSSSSDKTSLKWAWSNAVVSGNKVTGSSSGRSNSKVPATAELTLGNKVGAYPTVFYVGKKDSSSVRIKDMKMSSSNNDYSYTFNLPAEGEDKEEDGLKAGSKFTINALPHEIYAGKVEVMGESITDFNGESVKANDLSTDDDDEKQKSVSVNGGASFTEGALVNVDVTVKSGDAIGNDIALVKKKLTTSDIEYKAADDCGLTLVDVKGFKYTYRFEMPGEDVTLVAPIGEGFKATLDYGDGDKYGALIKRGENAPAVTADYSTGYFMAGSIVNIVPEKYHKITKLTAEYFSDEEGRVSKTIEPEKGQEGYLYSYVMPQYNVTLKVETERVNVIKMTKPQEKGLKAYINDGELYADAAIDEEIVLEKDQSLVIKNEEGYRINKAVTGNRYKYATQPGESWKSDEKETSYLASKDRFNEAGEYVLEYNASYAEVEFTKFKADPLYKITVSYNDINDGSDVFTAASKNVESVVVTGPADKDYVITGADLDGYTFAEGDAPVQFNVTLSDKYRSIAEDGLVFNEGDKTTKPSAKSKKGNVISYTYAGEKMPGKDIVVEIKSSASSGALYIDAASKNNFASMVSSNGVPVESGTIMTAGELITIVPHDGMGIAAKSYDGRRALGSVTMTYENASAQQSNIADGSEFSGVWDDEKGVYTFVMPGESISVSVEEDYREFAVEIEDEDNAHYNVFDNKSRTVEYTYYGEALTIRPADHYAFDVDDEDAAPIVSYGDNSFKAIPDYTGTSLYGKYSFNMPASDVTIKAAAKPVRNITVSGNAALLDSIQGALVVTGNKAEIVDGQDVVINIKPADNMKILGLKLTPAGNVTKLSATAYQFTADKDYTVDIEAKAIENFTLSLSSNTADKVKFVIDDVEKTAGFSQVFVEDSSVKVDVKAVEGYEISSFTVNGKDSTYPVTLTIQQDTVITADAVEKKAGDSSSTPSSSGKESSSTTSKDGDNSSSGKESSSTTSKEGTDSSTNKSSTSKSDDSTSGKSDESTSGKSDSSSSSKGEDAKNSSSSAVTEAEKEEARQQANRNAAKTLTGSLASALGSKGDGTFALYGSAADTVSVNATVKKGKIKQLDLPAGLTGNHKVTINTGIKFGGLTGYTVSSNLANAKDAKKATKVNKKGLLKVKAIKGQNEYKIYLTSSAASVEVTVIDFKFDKALKKTKFSAQTVSGNVVETAYQDPDKTTRYTVSSNVVTAGDLNFISGVWTIGKTAVNKIGEVGTATIGKVAVQYKVNDNGTLTIVPTSGKGSVKISYSLGGKVYKTGLKVK